MAAKKACEICKRISLIKAVQNPSFVKELKTGYVVIGDYQMFRGYALFLYKKHEEQLHHLSESAVKDFLADMAEVGRAVAKTFKPDGMNYELLGNSDRHLHWHIFPRYHKDPAEGKSIWTIPKKVRMKYKPTSLELESMKKQLRAELKNNHPRSSQG